MKTIVTSSSQETKKLGVEFARRVLKKGPAEKARVFGLTGELGSGKTTFTQGFSQGLGIRKNIKSPTYVIIRPFMIYDSRFMNFYHIDCYRVEEPEELLKLGFANICRSPQNIVLIEWADRVAKALPKTTCIIRFSHMTENKRKIVFPPRYFDWEAKKGIIKKIM